MNTKLEEYMHKRSISRQNSHQLISRASFTNLRIRSLTIDNVENDMEVGIGMEIYNEIPDIGVDIMMEWQTMILDEEKENDFADGWIDSDDENYKSDDEISKTTVLHSDHAYDDNDEEKEQDINIEDVVQSKNKMDDIDTHNATDQEIIDQLKVFGYKRDKIISAMEQVVSNNINEIVNKLEEDEEHNANIAKVIDDIIKNNITNTSSTEESVNIIDTEESFENDMKINDKETDDDKLKKRTIKRRFIEEEIIKTEEAYYDGLYTLLHEFIQPIFDNGYVDKKYYDKITSSIPNILQFHKTFLDELREVDTTTNGDDMKSEENKTKNKTLASVFNDCFMENKEKCIDIYMEYIKDYDMILDLFGSTFHDNLELKQFLKEKRRERKPLSGFLILPVQRVPRYILLLTDLRRNTEESNEDYHVINDAVTMIEDITSEINDRKKKIENLSQCLQIQEALNGLKEPIIDENRQFVEEFIFIKKKLKHQRLFFLFNDIVIIANEKWRVKKILDIRTLDVKIKDIETDDDNMKMRELLPRKSLVPSSNIRKSIVELTSDAAKDCKMEKELPEFDLISATDGNTTYVANDIESIDMFKKLIGKWRLNTIATELTTTLQSNETLGSIKDQLGRQALLYD